jgi:Tol biopolymer transport system component
MKKLLLLALTFTLSLTAFSQVTNVRRWRQTEKDSLNSALLMYEENQFLQALPYFESILNHHPKEEFIQYSYAKCALNRSDKHEDAYNYLTAIYAKNKKIEDIEYDVARAAHYMNKLDEADNAITSYLSKKKILPENTIKGLVLKKYIDNARYFSKIPTAAVISCLSDSINSAGEEFVPAITADESTLIYTYLGPKSRGGLLNDQSQPDPSGRYHEDIYLSTKKNGEFSKALELNNINTDANDAAISLSNDGNLLFIYRDNTDDHGDIYESYMNGGGYSSPSKIRGLVNSYSWDGHCSLSPDGKTLYFSSERGGGYGGRDIYKSTLMSDSTWGNIVNLGDSVNTKYDDDAPFIHPDGSSLYFSSKGHNSMGGYDVFRSVMGSDSSFKNSENLGCPINSTDDDIYFVVAANNKFAYYSSVRPGCKGLKDIYKIEPKFTNKSALVLVKGTVKSGSVAVSANIQVEITTKNNMLFKGLISNSSTGAYLVSLPAGASYKLVYNCAGQPIQSKEVNAGSVTDYTEKILDIVFDPAIPPSITNSVQPVIKDSLAVISKTTDIILPKESNDQIVKKTRDTFVPKNKYQVKTVSFVDQFGDLKAEGLVFNVQIGAFKNAANITYPNLEDVGKIQKITADGLTRICIGGDFKTLKKAFEFSKKVIDAGQSDAFVTMTYNGKRSSFEELESLGVFKTK